MLSELKDVFGKLKPQYDDDTVNRLNYIYTVFLISVFGLLVGAKQYVGKPLQCWVPQDLKGPGWEKYAESYCLVENTYFMDYNEPFPNSSDIRTSKELNYYQWVPIILALQALMFYLPRLVWSTLNIGSGLHIPGVIGNVLDFKKDKDRGNRRVLKPEEDIHKAEAVAATYMVEHLKFTEPPPYVEHDDGVTVEDENMPPRYSAIQAPKQPLLGHNRYRNMASISASVAPAKSFPAGYTSTIVMVFTKFLYVVNVIAQFFIMNSLFAPSYTLWGFEIFRDLINNREWDDSGHFPRVTYCDFDIVGLIQTRRYTVQCVLVINMLNEKIFLFLWWWFFALAIINISNFIYTILISFNTKSHRNFVKIYLDATKTDLTKNTHQTSDDAALSKFVRFLRPDGILTLRLMSENIGDLICSEMVVALWNTYWQIKPEPEQPVQQPESNVTRSTDGLHESLDDDKKHI